MQCLGLEPHRMGTWAELFRFLTCEKQPDECPFSLATSGGSPFPPFMSLFPEPCLISLGDWRRGREVNRRSFYCCRLGRKREGNERKSSFALVIGPCCFASPWKVRLWSFPHHSESLWLLFAPLYSWTLPLHQEGCLLFPTPVRHSLCWVIQPLSSPLLSRGLSKPETIHDKPFLV